MPLKKKEGNRRVVKAKSKSEIENSPKEQISELEKVMLAIKISEYENKVARKNQLCTYLEEELITCKTLFSKRQLLKSESMRLLSDAFEEFSVELFLLNQELNAMMRSYGEISNRAICNFRENVDKLTLLDAELENKLFEAKKNTAELPSLGNKYEALLVQSLKQEENFEDELKTLSSNFKKQLLRIEEELSYLINEMIENDDLKTDLLPMSLHSLSGSLNSSWLDSNLTCLSVLATKSENLQQKSIMLANSARENNQKLKSIVSQKIINEKSRTAEAKNFCLSSSAG